MLADGRCAVCRAADGGLASSEPIQLSHFVCRAGSGAVSARIGAVCIHRIPRPVLAAAAIADSAGMQLVACRLPYARATCQHWAAASKATQALECLGVQSQLERLACQYRRRWRRGWRPEALHCSKLCGWGRPALHCIPPQSYQVQPRLIGVLDHAGATAQLVAVGLASGDVALHKLYGWGRQGRRSNDAAYAEPLRVLSMYDWGYGPETLGAVAALQWSPDNRALAVSLNKRSTGLVCHA